MTNIQALPLWPCFRDEKLNYGRTISPLCVGEEALPDKLTVARDEARWAAQAREFISPWLLKMLSGGCAISSGVGCSGWSSLSYAASADQFCKCNKALAAGDTHWSSVSLPPLYSPGWERLAEQTPNSCFALCPERETPICLALPRQMLWDGVLTPCV